MQITPAAEEALRNLAQVRPGQPAPPINMTIAAELGNAGFAISPGHGGIEITQSGHQYLAVLDSGK
jgi:hypothetical protein